MSEGPNDSIRQEQKHRVAAEAQEREEKRTETQIRLLQEQADEAAQYRQKEEKYKKIERQHWRKQAALMKAQLKVAKRLNCISLISAVPALAALGTILLTYSQLKQSTNALHIDQRAWVAPFEVNAKRNGTGDIYFAIDL